jgi:hypothetical protein
MDWSDMRTWDTNTRSGLRQKEAHILATIGKVKNNIAQIEQTICGLIDYSMVSDVVAETVDEQIGLYDELYETLNRLLIERARLKSGFLAN